MSVEKPPRGGNAENLSQSRAALPSDQNDGSTRVDLGEDLIEKTAVLTISREDRSETSKPLDLSQVDDQLQSARILMGEGILEEAKRILRRILIADALSLDARKMLDEIQGIELKQILGETDNPRRRFGSREPETEVELSAETVLCDLDHDLNLRMAENLPSLFRDRAAMEKFGIRMDEDFASASAEDRVDLGIAFLEMGLHDLAVRHFGAAVQRLAREGSVACGDPGPLISATGLLAYAYILANRPFEGAMVMQTLLADAELPHDRKLDLLYLMGRAQEAMSNLSVACDWYRQVVELEPRYRDVDERLKSLAKPGARS